MINIEDDNEEIQIHFKEDDTYTNAYSSYVEKDGQFMKEVKGKFDFVVSRAVMPLNDLVPLVKRLIAPEMKNAVPNGLICLKGGDLSGEIQKYKADVLIDDLSNYFKEEFFKTKKVVYLPL